MSFDTWVLYVITVLVFMASPGPSHLLMVSVGLTNGFKKSLATAAGDLTANAIQITLAGFGLAAVVVASKTGFAIIQWAGVGYLIWVGSKAIINSFSQSADTIKQPVASSRALWLRGFVTSAANPKAIVFFAALFPQFLNTAQPLAQQVLILGATYIVIDGMFLCFYGFSASWLARKLKGEYRRWIQRVSGFGLIGSAVLLGFKSAE